MKCPHCRKKINPASLMAHQRAESLSKERREEIARNAARAMHIKNNHKLSSPTEKDK